MFLFRFYFSVSFFWFLILFISFVVYILTLFVQNSLLSSSGLFHPFIKVLYVMNDLWVLIFCSEFLEYGLVCSERIFPLSLCKNLYVLTSFMTRVLRNNFLDNLLLKSGRHIPMFLISFFLDTTPVLVKLMSRLWFTVHTYYQSPILYSK